MSRSSRRRERREKQTRPLSRPERKENVDSTTLRFKLRDSMEAKVVQLPNKVKSYADLQIAIARHTYRNNRFFVVQDASKRIVTCVAALYYSSPLILPPGVRASSRAMSTSFESSPQTLFPKASFRQPWTLN